jgi:hypothetical protein
LSEETERRLTASAGEQPLLLEELEDLDQALSPERLVCREGQLERRALDVVHEDLQVVGVDPPLLDGGVEEVGGVLRDELVEGGRVRHEHRHRGPRAPPRAARLLPRRSDAAGVADEDRRVEASDVDAQLEGVGRHDPQDRSVAEPPLDLPPPLGQVAAAVAPDDPLRSRLRLQRLLQIGDEDFGGEARGGERDRLESLPEEGEGDVAGGVEGGAADPELAVDDGRVVDGEVPLAAGGAAPVHERHLALGERLGQLPRVPDRGRRPDELGRGSVEAAEPAEAPEEVGHVRAVDPAQGVELVDHHVAQVLEQLHPLGVVGEDPLVEHVGVRDHHVGAGPDRLARVLGGVAVVGEGTDVRPQGFDGPVELGELVLGERLGGKEVESARVGILQDPVEDGKVVAEGLAGGSGRDDDDVAPRLELLVDLPLMRVEAREPPRLEDPAQLRVELRREVGELRRLGREMAEGGEHGLRPQRPLDLETLQDREQGVLGLPALQDELLAQVVSSPDPRMGIPAPTAP